MNKVWVEVEHNKEFVINLPTFQRWRETKDNIFFQYKGKKFKKGDPDAEKNLIKTMIAANEASKRQNLKLRAKKCEDLKTRAHHLHAQDETLPIQNRFLSDQNEILPGMEDNLETHFECDDCLQRIRILPVVVANERNTEGPDFVSQVHNNIEDNIQDEGLNDQNVTFFSKKDYLVREIYSAIHRVCADCRPSLTGHNGYGVYGELTLGSMSTVIKKMKEITDLNSTSIFLNVGSGLGKPTIHVSQAADCVSIGVESIPIRFYMAMKCLSCVYERAESNNEIKSACHFICSDILAYQNFNPFTHVYIFSAG
jgi:hypothetical protein